MPGGAAALAKQVRAIVGQRLDIFVSNAGVSKAAAIEEHTIEDFDKRSVLSREGAAAALPRGIEYYRRLLPGCSCCTRQSWATGRAVTPCLRGHERSAGNVGQALGCDARAARHPRQCRRSGGDRNGHVPFHEDRGGPRLHSRHAGTEAHRAAVGCGGRDRVSGLRRRALDHRCEHSGRWWVKALGLYFLNRVLPRLRGGKGENLRRTCLPPQFRHPCPPTHRPGPPSCAASPITW
jgi:hypothetical protein